MPTTSALPAACPFTLLGAQFVANCAVLRVELDRTASDGGGASDASSNVERPPHIIGASFLFGSGFKGADPRWELK